MKKFESKQGAINWMTAKVDDPCIDNERFAFVDDSLALADYHIKKANGCCGEFEMTVSVDGRQAIVGCNYGH